MVLGQAAPSGEALSSAQGAAYHIFNIIDRVSISNHVQLYPGLDPEATFGEPKFAKITTHRWGVRKMFEF